MTTALNEHVREIATGFMFRCRKCKAARRLDVPTRIHYADDGRHVRYRQYEHAGRWSTLYPLNATERFPVCCNRPMSGAAIRGRYVADVPCTAKCVAATGPACDCSCGGKNHGRGLS